MTSLKSHVFFLAIHNFACRLAGEQVEYLHSRLRYRRRQCLGLASCWILSKNLQAVLCSRTLRSFGDTPTGPRVRIKLGAKCRNKKNAHNSLLSGIRTSEYVVRIGATCKNLRTCCNSIDSPPHYWPPIEAFFKWVLEGRFCDGSWRRLIPRLRHAFFDEA